MSERVVIDKGGRVVIPKSVREELDLREGDLLVVERRDRDVVMRQEVEEFGLVRDGKRLFKPRHRKAGALLLEDINHITSSLRDPDLRRTIEAKERRRPTKKGAAR